jgi:hypothetical protein
MIFYSRARSLVLYARNTTREQHFIIIIFSLLNSARGEKGEIKNKIHILVVEDSSARFFEYSQIRNDAIVVDVQGR